MKQKLQNVKTFQIAAWLKQKFPSVYADKGPLARYYTYIIYVYL